MSRLEGKDFTLNSGATIHAKLSSAFLNKGQKQLPILCLSGFGCSHYNFIEIEKDLGDEFPMVLLDNRGMGGSTDVSEDYLLSDVVQDALEVMEQLEIPRFHLMGISMGGFLSQLLTLAAPEKVETLTLMCTTSGGEEYIPMPEMTEEMLHGFYALEEPRKTEMAVEATAHPTIKERAFGTFQKIVELRRAHPVRVDQIIKQKRAVDKFLLTPLNLESIKVPTLVLSGDADRFVNPKNGEIIQSHISGSLYKTVPDTDHLFFLEKPRMVARLIKEFFITNKYMDEASNPQNSGVQL
ncbi:MAG: alpha/beta hydrolase [Halobacteriovoraceae bacterium]|nr:alpha/beta hydrolase [Halobacteriovoraceae bacterium]